MAERIRVSHPREEEEVEAHEVQIPERDAPADEPVAALRMSTFQEIRQHFMDVRKLCLEMQNSELLGEVLNRVYEAEGFLTQLEKEALEALSQ
jgi:hypothetical protein